MASRAAAGTTVTYNSVALGLATDIQAAINGDQIDVTKLSAARAEFDVGQTDLDVTIQITGAAAGSLTVGGTAANLVITPNDGSGAITFTNMIVTNVAQGFPRRGEITSTVSFKAAYTA